MPDARELAAKWKREAENEFVPPEIRRAVFACAQELEDWQRDHDNALLSPNEAAAETGLAPATIRKKLSSGDWPNEGTPYRPKVRRRALREAMSKQVATRLQVVR